MTHSGKRLSSRPATALACVLCFCAPGAMAQSAAIVPEDCTPVATVHKNNCVASTIVTCGEGEHRSLTYRRGKLSSTNSYDADWSFTKWETRGAGAMEFAAVPGTGAAMSVAALKATGTHEGTGDFVINSKVIRNQGYTLTGSTNATGETVTVSGEAFAVYHADRAFARKGASQVLTFAVDIYISQSRDLVIEGTGSRGVNDMPMQSFDMTPRAVYGPGDPGFLQTMSEFGCG